MRYGFVVDQRRCIGCHACSVACKAENNVSLGVFRTWVKYVEKGAFPNVRRVFQVNRCNHCENPPCVAICPVGAMFQRHDGIVDFDSERCIGCKGCLQACPYDAIHLDPARRTASKCHFCAHRVDRGMEPACVAVCPERALLAGDFSDPESEVSALVANEKARVRKPEEGTQPRVFYLGADDVAMVPAAAATECMYFWSERNKKLRGGAVKPAKTDTMPAPVRVAYDVDHERAWHWQVPVYFWTKSVSAGALLLSAFAGPLLPHSAQTALATVIVALAAMAITVALLVSDLSRPERFFRVLTSSRGKSWITLGAWVLIAYTLLCALYGAAVYFKLDGGRLLLLPAALAGVATAVYTAFLFGQCEGRALWQTPLLPVHLVVQAVLASAAVLALLPFAGDRVPKLVPLTLAVGLALHALMLIGELGLPHATEPARYGAKLILGGPFRNLFWLGAVGVGLVLPAMLLALGWGSTLAMGCAGVCALLGLLAFEWVFVMAGQGVPNS